MDTVIITDIIIRLFTLIAILQDITLVIGVVIIINIIIRRKTITAILQDITPVFETIIMEITTILIRAITNPI